MLAISQISLAAARHHLPGRADSARWNGQAAVRLGLHGQVKPGQLETLWDWGWRYDLPDSLTPALKTPQPDKSNPPLAGYFFGFSPPRTLAARADLHSARFEEALQASAQAILHAVEVESQTWFRDGRRLHRHTTGNLLWMTPLREEPRPGRALWPYVSGFVFNVTWDPLEARWKSVRLTAVRRYRAEYQQAFYDTLRDRVNAFDSAPGESL
ncbi:MAG TPA: relaxase domain-containing protein [Gemmataceae bacterium]|jgi:hypothetical protein